MSSILLRIAITISLLSAFKVSASTFAMIQGGYNIVEQNADHETVNLKGISKSAGIGMRKDFLEFEMSFLKLKAEGSINHDDIENKILHDQTSFLFAANFYFTRYFYFRLGYGIHKIKQKLKDEVSSVSNQGAVNEYNLQEDITSSSVLYGAGLVLFQSKSLSLYTQLEAINYSSLKAKGWNPSLGLRYYFE